MIINQMKACMKDENLIALELELKNLFPKYGLADQESVFELGVKFGRQLERLGIENYEPEYWKQKKQEEALEQKIREKVDKVENFIAQLVRLSVKDLIREKGSWTIAKRDFGYGVRDQFSDETIEKYQIRIVDVDMESYGGDFEIRYEVVGELGEKFKKYKIYEQFTSLVYNENGEEEQSIYDVDNVDAYIDRLTVHVRNSNKWEIDQYDVFLNDISKPFLFVLLQTNS
jgi:hypothetical protein